MNKTYLGDGVYLREEGDRLVLTAENGIAATDTIYLEPEIAQRLRKAIEKFLHGTLPD